MIQSAAFGVLWPQRRGCQSGRRRCNSSPAANRLRAGAAVPVQRPLHFARGGRRQVRAVLLHWQSRFIYRKREGPKYKGAGTCILRGRGDWWWHKRTRHRRFSRWLPSAHLCPWLERLRLRRRPRPCIGQQSLHCGMHPASLPLAGGWRHSCNSRAVVNVQGASLAGTRDSGRHQRSDVEPWRDKLEKARLASSDKHSFRCVNVMPG